MKFIEKHHRKICILLCVSILTCCTYQSFKQPEEVKAAIVIDDALWIALALMAACGVGYVGLNWYGNTAENLEDPFGEEAQKACAKVYDHWNVSAGMLNENLYEFDPENGDPEEDPPSWEKLVEWIKNHPNVPIAIQGTAFGAVLLAVANKLWEDREKGQYVNDDLDKEVYEELKSYMNDYPYVVILDTDVNDRIEIFMFDTASYLYKDGNYYCLGQASKVIKGTYGKTLFKHSWAKGYGTFNTSREILSTNINIYESIEEAKAAENKITYPGTINPANTTEYTGLEMDEEGNITELPTGSFNLPSANAWAEYLSALAEAQSAADVGLAQQAAVDKLVETVGTEPETSTDPDIGTDTGGDSDTDTDTDEDTSTELTDEEKSNFLLPESIKEKFPFCIPFDIIEAFSVLESTERKAPAFTVPLKVDRYNFYYEIDVDLSMFDEVAELMRTMELILFIIGLGFSTKTLMKG